MITLIDTNNIDDRVKKYYDECIFEIQDLFQNTWIFKPNIFLFKTRDDWNSFLGQQTKNWSTGCAFKSCVFMFDINTIERESNGYHKTETFKNILKHEMVHCFVEQIFNIEHSPSWLNEGIAVYSAGQIKVNKNFDKNKILSSYGGFEGDFYNESGMFVEYLIKTYGINIFKELLIKSKKVVTLKRFLKLFYSIYPMESEL